MNKCRAFGMQCLKCNKLNHFTKCCKSKNNDHISKNHVHNIKNNYGNDVENVVVLSL